MGKKDEIQPGHTMSYRWPIPILKRLETHLTCCRLGELPSKSTGNDIIRKNDLCSLGFSGTLFVEHDDSANAHDEPTEQAGYTARLMTLSELGEFMPTARQ